MVHALLWEPKADLHSSKLHEWTEHWKSIQPPEVLEYMASKSSKRLSEQVCALDVFFIAFELRKKIFAGQVSEICRQKEALWAITDRRLRINPE